MENLNQLITDTVPSYFKNVPVPRTFRGFLDLKFSEWLRLLAFTGAIGAVGYVTVQGLYATLPSAIVRKLPRGKRHHRFQCNHDFEKHKKKLTDHLDIEDMGIKTALCRCWKSKKMPYCDGAHKYHNRETGDNVGAIVIHRRTHALDNSKLPKN